MLLCAARIYQLMLSVTSVADQIDYSIYCCKEWKMQTCKILFHDIGMFHLIE